MVLEGKLSADKGTQTQPNCRSQDSVWRREQGRIMVPGKVKPFCLKKQLSLLLAAA